MPCPPPSNNNVDVVQSEGAVGPDHPSPPWPQPVLMEAVATMIQSGKMAAGPAEPARASKQDIILGSSGLAPLRKGNLELFSFGRVVGPDVVEAECTDLLIIGRLIKRVFLPGTINLVQRVVRQNKWSGMQSL